MRLGRIERLRPRWRAVADLQVPVLWEQRFDGEEIDPLDRSDPASRFMLHDVPPAGLFSRP
jgi:hypothetical protein